MQPRKGGYVGVKERGEGQLQNINEDVKRLRDEEEKEKSL